MPLMEIRVRLLLFPATTIEYSLAGTSGTRNRTLDAPVIPTPRRVFADHGAWKLICVAEAYRPVVASSRSVGDCSQSVTQESNSTAGAPERLEGAYMLTINSTPNFNGPALSFSNGSPHLSVSVGVTTAQ